MKNIMKDMPYLIMFVFAFLCAPLKMQIILLALIVLPIGWGTWFFYDQRKYVESLPKDHLTCDIKMWNKWKEEHPRWAKKWT